MPKNNIRTITSMAMLIAISVVLARWIPLFYTGDMRLTLGNIPIILSGIFFGPVAGGVSGFLADIIGCVLVRGEAYFPPLALSPILIGVIPGLCAKFIAPKIRKGMGNVLLISPMIIIMNTLTTVLWSTYALSLLLGKGFLILLPGRSLETVLQSVAEIIILSILLNNRNVNRLFGVKKENSCNVNRNNP